VIALLLLLAVMAVSAQTLGDANADGTININDALVAARYVGGLSVPTINTTNADVNGNSQVEITDAMLIARYIAGIITSFPGQTQTKPPLAVFTISNITPAVNTTVSFNASGSSDPDGTITGYNWDFGDGTKATGVSVSHAFTTMDDYKVALTVTDNSQLTKKVTHRVFVGRPQGWTEATHHKSADGDYDLVFSEDQVNRVDIIISAANYKTMEDDVAKWVMGSKTDPVYVPVTLKFNNYTWWNVGMRYKGNSTLSGPKQSRDHKYPFHLNFDKYEDTYPEIKDQHFYGFSELICNNNWYDASFVRDVVCADIFREGGVPTARGAFYRVYIDTGSGPVYWGLYTFFEDPADVMLKSQFPDPDGNMYKPEGTGADWRTFNQTAFVKKTNEAAADWSDVQAAVTALNSSRTDAAAWRARLDTYLNTNSFLRWLAINTAIVNWDSYGSMAQNYYLYGDLTDNGRLIWIPWDFNMSLTSASMRPGLSLALSEVTSSWPLIRYLMDDPTYKAVYHQEMRIMIDGCFNEASVKARIQKLHTMLRPYTVGSEGESSSYSYLSSGATEYDKALTDLLNHITTRQTTVRNYLNTVN
jgi:hypothetical protein